MRSNPYQIHELPPRVYSGIVPWCRANVTNRFGEDALFEYPNELDIIDGKPIFFRVETRSKEKRLTYRACPSPRLAAWVAVVTPDVDSHGVKMILPPHGALLAFCYTWLGLFYLDKRLPKSNTVVTDQVSTVRRAVSLVVVSCAFAVAPKSW